MGKALYRQFRPASFDEVIGQEHITTTLKNSLKNDTIGHAYLLTGPRGVGKTSIARILAYAVNDVPYDTSGNYLDIIEIDAASNRRIDEIRSLREKVHIAPTSGKYKVYIIDEVHMLTREAFNALLKTLEEPPAHVIFILATTEMHKLPDTIVSRCISFTFRPIDSQNIVKHLQHIADTEGFTIAKDALELLAVHGDGSFRDSISLLDQVKNPGAEVTKSDIELSLGLASHDQVEQLLQDVANGDPKSLQTHLQEAYAHGATDANISKQIAASVRQSLIDNQSTLGSEAGIQLLQSLLQVSGSVNPRARLELALLDQLFKQKPVAASITITAKPEEPKKPAPEITKEEVTPTPEPTQETPEVPKPEPEPEAVATVNIEASKDLWNDILKQLKTKNNTLYGIARMAQAEHIGNTFTITFSFPFHYKKFNQAQNKAMVATIIESLGHANVDLDIALKSAKTEAPASAPKQANLDTITNIFGDGEVLES